MEDTLLKSKNYRVGAWKNGGGTSTEIAVFPPDADFTRGEFLWRLSSASFAGESPFSEFQGFDRFLCLASGKSLELRFGNRNELLEPGKVLQFRGEDTVIGAAAKGPVTDLGLIFCRGAVEASFNVVEIGAQPKSYQVSGTVAFVVALGEPVRATLYPGENAFTLKAGDALRFGMRQTDSGTERIVLLEPPEGKRGRAAIIELSITNSQRH